MKKTVGWMLGIIAVLVIAFYFIFSGSNPGTATANTPTTTTNSGGAGTGGTGTGTSGASGSTGNTGAAPTGQYKDGTYTGPVADAVYGQLQIVATISGGKLTGISWPIYPNSGGHTVQVSQSALPQLKQEAIAAQSANVNIVSGATQTSQAYQQSLAAALAQAKA